MKFKLTAFSLIEVLISLITVSLVVAAFAPVISKRSARNIAVQESKPECPQNWQMPIEIEGEKFCFTKFNVGDFVNGVGVDIPLSAGIKPVQAGQSCGEKTNYTEKCCWTGKTSGNTCDLEENGTYSGCNRTVCTWAAANEICKNLGMELPASEQIEEIYLNHSKGLGESGAQFCDFTQGYNASYCRYTNNTCPGSYKDWCSMDGLWSLEYSSSDAYYVNIRSGVIYHNQNHPKTYAFSVRCIVPAN